MSKQPTRRRRDYPIRIHADDMSLGLTGEVVISGPDAVRFRNLVLAHRDFYRRFVVPYMQRFEATFKPTDVWIDAKSRIHVTNANLVARARKRLAANVRNVRRPKGER